MEGFLLSVLGLRLCVFVVVIILLYYNVPRYMVILTNISIYDRRWRLKSSCWIDCLWCYWCDRLPKEVLMPLFCLVVGTFVYRMMCRGMADARYESGSTGNGMHHLI